MSFKIRVGGKSDVGKRRSNNQDSILVSEPLKLFAVADGMGGHSGGEVASALAVRTIEKFFQESRVTPITKRLNEAMVLANRVIYEHAAQHPALRGMGTTLSTAVVDDGWIHFGQVGDSRGYLYREGELFQITEDHSQVYELIKAGLLNESNMHQVHKNVITRSVGFEENVDVDVITRQALKGDRYLLCSDGLSGMVSNDEIARVLGNFTVEQAVWNLIDLANLKGGEDNVSVIVFELG